MVGRVEEDRRPPGRPAGQLASRAFSGDRRLRYSGGFLGRTHQGHQMCYFCCFFVLHRPPAGRPGRPVGWTGRQGRPAGQPAGQPGRPAGRAGRAAWAGPAGMQGLLYVPRKAAVDLTSQHKLDFVQIDWLFFQGLTVVVRGFCAVCGLAALPMLPNLVFCWTGGKWQMGPMAASRKSCPHGQKKSTAQAI